MINITLVTNRHPAEFKRRGDSQIEQPAEDNLKLILFPLKKYCKDTTEVIDLIQKIFLNIKQETDLDYFSIKTEKKKGVGGAFVNSIIFEPNVAGMGFSFNKFKKLLRGEG